MIASRRQLTGTVGAGFVDPAPDDWEEAKARVAERAAGGTSEEFVLTPRVVCRAYLELYQKFDDPAAHREMASWSVEYLVQFWLDL